MTIFVKIPTCKSQRVEDDLGNHVEDDEGNGLYTWVDDNDTWVNPDLVSKIVRNGPHTRISLMTRSGSTYSTETIDSPETPEQILERFSGLGM